MLYNEKKGGMTMKLKKWLALLLVLCMRYFLAEHIRLRFLPLVYFFSHILSHIFLLNFEH